jgi:hypothetical protein
MAAPLGFKTFATGDVLTAADTNGYLMQGVWAFADAAARTAAVTSPQEGNMSYLKDTDSVQYYSGSAWVSVGGSSGLTKITTQSFTSVSAVNVNNCFSATYKRYRVLIKVIAASGVPDLGFKQRIAGTDTTGNYYYAGRSESWNNASTLNYGKNVSAYILNTVGTPNQTTYSLDVQYPYTGTMQINGGGVCPDAGVTFTTAGTNLGGGTVDGFSLIPSSSTITGEVTIYGYAD